MKDKINAVLKMLKVKLHCYCAIEHEFYVLSATEEPIEQWVLILGCRKGTSVFKTFEDLKEYTENL